MTAMLRRQGWALGLLLLLVALFAAARLVQPGYGAGDVGSLVRAALPYAFAVAAQTVVVIAGGIDLSVAATMALTSVTAAALMSGADESFALVAVPLVLLLGFALGALNGVLIVATRVPDIIVTLATLFMFGGAALLVLESPGGGAAEWLKALIVGTLPVPGLPDAATAWMPKALIVLLVCLCAVWIPLRRSRLGLSLYAIGSNELAAFRSGVAVACTRILAYAIGGLFSAMGGLSLTMSTGIGSPIPGPYLLASVAAVVLGGVTLGGGRGGLLGPILAVFVLRLVRTLLTLLAVDPNATTIVEGAIMVGVVMLGAFVAMRSQRA
ncbi:ABC transporter permease [Aureimonas sp. AU4]|uniref:ABC transporter permease n=1 Tax=Aureimonas sp. AU4 TaxID=1638163 RepID=UPI000782B19B|nr:ABC transporter permease [Aureimonas sp. AU4]